MQTLSFLFVLLLLFCAAQVHALRNLPSKNLTSQLAQHLTHPVIVDQCATLDAVLISFRIDTNNQLTDLRVYSTCQSINTTLTQHLAGIKIHNAGLDAQRTHWASIRFLPK